MDDLNTLLASLGLENQEASVYLTAIRLGTSAASIIAKRCNIPRSTARYTCEQLVSKQLMTATQKGNTLLFTAESPEKLNKLLDSQREQVELRQQRLDASLQDLKRLYNPLSVLPKVTFYEGLDGIDQAYGLFAGQMEPNTEVLIFVKVVPEIEYELKDVPAWREFITHRVSKNVRARVIAPQSSDSLALQASDANELRETRLGSPELFDFQPGEIMVYGNKLFSMTKEGNFYFAFIVENKNLAATMRSVFEIVWLSAEKAGMPKKPAPKRRAA